MKKNYYFALGLGALMMTSCAQDETNGAATSYDNSKVNVDLIYNGNMGDGGTTTRMTHDDHTQSGLFHWQGSKDHIGVLCNSTAASLYSLTLTQGDGGNEATFAQSNAAVPAGSSKFTLFYPSLNAVRGFSTSINGTTKVNEMLCEDQGNGIKWYNETFGWFSQETKAITTSTTTVDLGDGQVMQHKRAYLKFVIYDSGSTYTGNYVTGLTLTSAANNLSGTYTVDLSGTACGSLTFGSDATKSVRLSSNTGFKNTIATSGAQTLGTTCEYATATSVDNSMIVIPAATYAANDLTVTVSLSNGKQLTKTLSTAMTVAASSVTRVKLNLADFTAVATPTYQDYYEWDAKEAYTYTKATPVAGDDSYYNTAGSTSVSASNSCAFCPTSLEIIAYLNAGVIWDDGRTITGTTTPTYIIKTNMSNGTMLATPTTTTFHEGLWLKKKAAIIRDGGTFPATELGSTTPVGNNQVWGFTNPSANLTDATLTTVRTSADYFFLPALGFYSNGTINHIDDNRYGHYWAKDFASTNPYDFDFGFNSAHLSAHNTAGCGFGVWTVQ